MGRLQRGRGVSGPYAILTPMNRRSEALTRRLRGWEARHPVAAAVLYVLLLLAVGLLAYWDAERQNARIERGSGRDRREACACTYCDTVRNRSRNCE